MPDGENAAPSEAEERGTLFAFDFSQPVEPLVIADGVCVRAGEELLNRIEHAMHASGEYPPGEPKRRWRRGRIPYVVLVGSEVVSYGWTTPEPEPMDDLGVSFTAPPGEVWLYDFATVPEFRGRRLYPALLRFILKQLKDQDVSRTWIGTSPGNIASQRGISRAGFTLVCETEFVGRPGQGHFVIYPTAGVPEELVHVAVKTVHGRLADD
ncbi:MAG: GNAT family N-acetyltransferase [Chloroflexota bacterium]